MQTSVLLKTITSKFAHSNFESLEHFAVVSTCTWSKGVPTCGCSSTSTLFPQWFWLPPHNTKIISSFPLGNNPNSHWHSPFLEWLHTTRKKNVKCKLHTLNAWGNRPNNVRISNQATQCMFIHINEYMNNKIVGGYWITLTI